LLFAKSGLPELVKAKTTAGKSRWEPAVLVLSEGSLSVGLVPQLGGSIAWFRREGVDLMRPLSRSDADSGNVLGVAMFPMVPYANRIAGNAFWFGGRTWQFEANNPPERFNVHGTGWHSQWQSEHRGTSVLLSLDYVAPDEPYSYRATPLFSLAFDGLTVALTLTNQGGVEMPFGFGLHPWFDRTPNTTLSFRASHFFMEGPEGIATEVLAVPPELDFAARRPLPDTWRNNDYGGWNGIAEIRFPERGVGLTIEADPVFGHLMLYSDPQKPYFCLEPQSNAPCAFNRMAGKDGALFGARTLAPGAGLEGSIRFRPFAISPT
jgi:aldose 1-epimerase